MCVCVCVCVLAGHDRQRRPSGPAFILEEACGGTGDVVVLVLPEASLAGSAQEQVWLVDRSGVWHLLASSFLGEK